MPSPYSRHSALTCSSRPWVTTPRKNTTGSSTSANPRKETPNPDSCAVSAKAMIALDKVPRYGCSRLLISALATARAVWSVKCSGVMNCRMLCRSGPAWDSSTITSVDPPGGRCRVGSFAEPAAGSIMLAAGLRRCCHPPRRRRWPHRAGFYQYLVLRSREKRPVGCRVASLGPAAWLWCWSTGCCGMGGCARRGRGGGDQRLRGPARQLRRLLGRLGRVRGGPPHRQRPRRRNSQLGRDLERQPQTVHLAHVRRRHPASPRRLLHSNQPNAALQGRK